MKNFLVLVALATVPSLALASPTPVPSPRPSVTQAKAIGFLDNIAASYRKLNSLSVTWRDPNNIKEEGNFSWRNSKPAQLRYERLSSGKRRYLFVSNGIRTYQFVPKENSGGEKDSRYVGPVSANDYDSPFSFDKVTPVLLRGKNPLRVDILGARTEGQGRLLGVKTINGVRCRGVEITVVVEAKYTHTFIYEMWFDSRNMMRRFGYEGMEGSGEIDFKVRRNVKLSPTLFTVPKRPDGSY